jgi:hypothetical protein
MAVAGSTFGLPFWDCFGSIFGLGPSGFFLVIVLGEILHKLTLHHMVVWLSESS